MKQQLQLTTIALSITLTLQLAIRTIDNNDNNNNNNNKQDSTPVEWYGDPRDVGATEFTFYDISYDDNCEL
jgi:hypothetical protein